MGKVTGFLEYERLEEGYEPVAKRVKNYKEFVIALDAEQLRIAVASRSALAKSKPFKEPIVTEAVAATTFYPAEDYHQDYFENHPGQGYCVAVAAPKVAKFRKTFARLQKT